MVNWMAAGQAGVNPTSPGVIKNQMQVWGIDGRTVPVDLYDFGSIHLAGRVPLARSRVGVADLVGRGAMCIEKRVSNTRQDSQKPNPHTNTNPYTHLS